MRRWIAAARQAIARAFLRAAVRIAGGAIDQQPARHVIINIHCLEVVANDPECFVAGLVGLGGNLTKPRPN